MQADGTFSYRYHRAAFDLVSDLCQDLADQCGNVTTAEAFAPDADHRRSARAANRQQSVEV
jgi:hypothetical protein